MPDDIGPFVDQPPAQLEGRVDDLVDGIEEPSKNPASSARSISSSGAGGSA
jgi:hypothetical protein